MTRFKYVDVLFFCWKYILICQYVLRQSLDWIKHYNKNFYGDKNRRNW